MKTKFATVLILLAAAALPCVGGAFIVPRAAALHGGQVRQFEVRTTWPHRGATEDWVWQALGDGTGILAPVAGRFTAPDVTAPTLLTLTATHRHHPDLKAETTVLALPAEPFGVVHLVLGPDWLTPFTASLPFLDPATGQRMNRTAGPVTSLPWVPPAPKHVAGYGVPFTIRWRPEPNPRAQLLTYQQGDDLVQQDVTGLESVRITTLERLPRFSVEALVPTSGPRPGWTSRRQVGAIHLRGAAPLAGNALAAGHADGLGRSAHFQEPFGLAILPGWGLGPTREYLVTDPGQHVIRLVSETGAVRTPWGQAGQPGHQDREPGILRRLVSSLVPSLRPPTRFNRPTFICVDESPGWPVPSPNPRCLVSDSGNHVIRVLEGNVVRTLAGTPGLPGHRDGTGNNTLFNNPQGLVAAPDGTIYVADQGNGVIRKIAPDGQVSTLSGTPGSFGSQDGPGVSATFTDLHGLALSEATLGPQALFVADGHAVRRISLDLGEVATVLGVVDAPGFQDIQHGSAEARRAGLRQPCLHSPCGLLATSRGLAIADQGNHSIRRWEQAEGTLVTQVGDPTLPQLRWGLLRDGMDVPLDERFATLASPRTLLDLPWSPGTQLVTAGTCLVEIQAAMDIREELGGVELDVQAADVSQPCLAQFTVISRDPWKEPLYRTIQYSVDFLEPDGALASRSEGTSSTSMPIQLEGQFSQRGRGEVVVRCVTEDGVSAWARKFVEII